MIKTVTVEQLTCDICQVKPASPSNACLSCGKLICYECGKLHAVQYPHALNFGGSDDGRYCLPCNDAKIAEGRDQLFLAYREISRLRAECKSFSDVVEAKAKVAEATIKRLRP